MGYLSQKKKFAREGAVLKLLLLVFGVFTFLPMLMGTSWVAEKWLFQVYITNLLAFFYALYIRRMGFSLLLALFLVLNYFQISAEANLFFNDRVAAEHHVAFSYQPKTDLQIEADNSIILRRGHLLLGKEITAPFVAFEKNGHVFTLIRINLASLSPQAHSLALAQLRSFVTGQDDPVIVFGDFGSPVWMPRMTAFLEATGLEVKNRLLFTASGSRHHYFGSPNFYILSFQNVGIEKLHVQAPEGGNYPEIFIRLGFY